MEIVYLLLTIILIEITYLLIINQKKLVYKKETRPIFVDTSVLIDGRIIEIAKTGFLFGSIRIPRSVIGELQTMADGSDSEKRSRARFGLDIIAELQKVDDLDVEIFQDKSQTEEGVDERLIFLAKKYDGIICTIDYNLNKVATAEKIKVININDLAMSIKMAYLPSEKIQIELTQKGQDSKQAIGHLADGTMVVVENAIDKIGKIVEIEFIRSFQTSAGKMMFAKLYKQKNVNKNISFTDRRRNVKRKETNQARYKSKQTPSREQNVINLIDRQR
ncbi:MAG TPA: hypothetical protein PLO25_00335 [Candidatus Saccharibacteria bacterium]|nr:hypothetical protein [Candidatus Saccharibacteria bacterium]